MRGIWLSAVAGVTAATVTPVEKVITLLEGLQSKVVAEGTEEAKTYDAFACFCRDQSEKKNNAITENEDTKGQLEAEMGEEESKRDRAVETIKFAQEDLSYAQEDLKSLQEEDKNRRLKYATTIEDLSSALKSLEDATMVLKASKATPQTLLAMKSTLRTAGVMAQALGLGNKLLMQLSDDVPTSNYDFHSGGIVETLEGLLHEFRETKTNTDKDEVQAAQENKQDRQSVHDHIAMLTKELENAKARKAEAQKNLGRASGDFTLATATLNDDRNYLDDLTKKCNEKADLWNDRQTMRTDELTALTQALVVLKDTVSKKTTDQTVRLLQDESTSFVQTTSTKHVRVHRRRLLNAPPRRGFLQARDPREMVADFLRNQADSFHSAALATMATAVGKEGTFDKITEMIQAMIEKLQKQASKEEDHNGYCVKATRTAEEKRDMKADVIRKMNSAAADGEVQIEKLTALIAKLEEEINTLVEDLEKAQTQRDTEHNDNDKAIADAEEGETAVKSAIETLDRFYKTAQNKQDEKLAARAQKDADEKAARTDKSEAQKKADDLPDAGFDEEYGASQDDSVGVLGMLEVIRSDFARTIRETEKTEEEQSTMFRELKTDNTASQKTKDATKTGYTQEKEEATVQLDEDMNTMAEAQRVFDSTIASLMELHKACVDTEMTHEERAEAREHEIDSLKQAYKLLEEHTPGQ